MPKQKYKMKRLMKTFIFRVTKFSSFYTECDLAFGTDNFYSSVFINMNTDQCSHIYFVPVSLEDDHGTRHITSACSVEQALALSLPLVFEILLGKLSLHVLIIYVAINTSNEYLILLSFGYKSQWDA